METTKLAALIDCKLQIMQLLARLAQQQAGVVDGGDMTNLLRLLAAKQTVMDQLQKVERDLDPFRNHDPDARRWQSDAARERCQKNVEQCNDLLAQIVALEQECEGKMIRRRDDAACKLQGVHSAAEAQAAYGASWPAQRSTLPPMPGQDFTSEG